MNGLTAPRVADENIAGSAVFRGSGSTPIGNGCPITRPFDPEAGNLRYNGPLQPMYEVNVGDIRMTLLPPGPVDVIQMANTALIDINLSPAAGEIAINSDQWVPMVAPADSLGFYPRGTAVKHKCYNALPSCALEIGDKTLSDWFERGNVSPDYHPEGNPYTPDPVASGIGRAAIQYLNTSIKNDTPADLLTFESIVLGLSARFMATAQATDGDVDAEMSSWGHKRDDLRMRRVLEYTHSKLGDPNLKISDMADVACLSSCHFSLIFKKWKGVSPYSYVLQARLEMARDLLLGTHMCLAEISYASGFSSQSHMTGAFKKHFGVSPARMRS